MEDSLIRRYEDCGCSAFDLRLTRAFILKTQNASLKRPIGTLFQRLDRPASVLGVVFVGAFLETTVLPIPFELLLVPLMLCHRQLLWMIVLAALAGCMIGAFAGYAIGLYAYQSFGLPVLHWLDIM